MATRKGFTFEPRTLTNAPKQFGSISVHLNPAEGVSESDPRFQSAQLQHLLANEVREFLGVHRLDVAWLASTDAGHPGVSVDRMRRMLRGETMMQITDMLLITDLVATSKKIVQGVIGVDLEEEEELRRDHRIMSWVMEGCVCPAKRKVPPQR